MDTNQKNWLNFSECVHVVRTHLTLWIWLHRRRLQSRARGLVAPFVPIP